MKTTTNLRPSSSRGMQCFDWSSVFFAVFATGLLVGAPVAQTATYIFNQTSGTSTWSTPSVWTPSGPPPLSTDSITYAGATATSLDIQTSRAVDVISKVGTGRIDIGNFSGTSVATLTVASVVGTTANFFFRNAGNGGVDASIGNINVSAGTTGFGVSTSTGFGNLIRNVTVSGTTSISGGALQFNVSNTAGNAYSLGHLSVTGGTVSLALRNADAGHTGVAQVSGLSGNGGAIQAGVLANMSSNSVTLAITNAANFSSSTELRNSSAANGAVLSITKAGSGTQTLSGSNSYTGGTTVNAGTLLVTSTNGVGTGAVRVSEGVLHVNALSGSGAITNAVTITDGDGRYVLERASGMAFSAFTASSDIVSGIDTTAALLGGTASAARTLTTSFATVPTVSASNDGIRVSDVFSLNGTGTDIFVLQLQIADVSAGQYLGWLDGSNAWVNAVNGNAGLVGVDAVTNFAGSFAASGASATADFLGSWGYDTSANTVWAVLDHNSQFAVIPEPSTCLLLGVGLSALYLRRRTRRCRE